jgi:hypothetical protein
VNPDHLRAFAGRDFEAIAREKRAHLRRLFERDGAAGTIRLARGLWVHARALDPAWPHEREREADLASHVELKALLDRAARAGCGQVIGAAGDQPGR